MTPSGILPKDSPTGASIVVSKRPSVISSHSWPTSTSSTRKGTNTSSRAITSSFSGTISASRRRGVGCNPDSPISGQSETARSGACSRPPTPFSSHKLWENDWRPRMERVQLNGADIEFDVRGSGEPVVFIHGAILSDGFVPVIEQTGIAENFQIVDYRRRGYAGSSRALAGITMQAWAGDCIALLNHLGIASAHVAGHSFGAAIALQMAIDAPRQSAEAGIAGTAAPVVGAVRRAVHGMGGICPRDLRLGRQNCGHGHGPGRRVLTRLPAIHRRRPARGCVRPRGIRYRHVLSGRTRSHATLEYHNRRPERYSTPGAVDARQRYIAGIL